MKVAVVGAGFVGLTTSCMLATKGFEVELFDIDEIKIDSINKGIVPFYEQDLEANLNLNINTKKLIAKKISSISAENYGAVLICVGTPSKQDGSIDLSHVESALILICSSVSEKIPIVIRSTVLPGTTRALQEKILRLGFHHNLAMVPEFLREGTALHDSLTPDRIIIGSSNSLVIEVLEILFAAGSVKKIITSTYSAEFIKYLTNTFLATCISFTNELFSFVNEDTEFFYEDVISGWHFDRRFQFSESEIGITNYLKPGPGFGGSCFPKDIRAINYAMMASGFDSSIVNSVINRNDQMPNIVFSWIENFVETGEKVLLLGIAFKENTDDLRESVSIKIIEKFQKAGVETYWYDKYVHKTEESLKKSSVDISDISNYKHIVLSNNDPFYISLLDTIFSPETRSSINIYAIKNQNHLVGFNWLTPRAFGAYEY